MKPKGKATGGDAKRRAIDACHAIMRESHFSVSHIYTSQSRIFYSS
jgi:hypothetical protein